MTSLSEHTALTLTSKAPRHTQHNMPLHSEDLVQSKLNEWNDARLGHPLRRGALQIHSGLLLLLLLLPNFITVFYSSSFETLGGAASFLVFCFVSTAAPALVTRTLRQYFIIVSPLVLLAPAFAFYTIAFRSVPSDGVILAVVKTNLSEALSMLGAFGWLSALPVAALVIYLYLAIHSPHLDRHVDSRSRKILLAVFFYYVLAAVTHFQVLRTYFDARPIVDESMLRESFPFGLLLTAGEAIAKDSPRRNKDFLFSAYKKDALAEKEIYVLVIGESSRFGNWNVNGYPRPTSPNMSRLHAEGNLISFADVAAASNSTQMSVPVILTRGTPGDFKLASREASLAQAFREAGFRTGWISNQDDVYPPDADFSSIRAEWNHRRHDESMLPQVDAAIKQNGSKIFLIVHTLGSHIDYDDRYAPRFKMFKPTLYDLGKPISPDVRDAVINSYDNSIVATDDLINRVIARVDSEGCVCAVFYVSDHGENLFDDARNLFMHSGPAPTRYETHVPAFIWTSALYKSHYSAKVDSLEKNRSSKLSHTNVFHTVLDMANIGLDGEQPSMSFASHQFSEPTYRLILNPHWKTERYEDLK